MICAAPSCFPNLLPSLSNGAEDGEYTLLFFKSRCTLSEHRYTAGKEHLSIIVCGSVRSMQELIIQGILFVLCPVIVTAMAINLLKPVAIKLGLVDQPGGRKTHQGAPPLIGGLAIFVGYSITWALHLNDSHLLMIYTGCAALVVVLGVVDDARNLSVRVRLMVQIFVALAMCWTTGKYLVHFGNLFGTGEIDAGPWGILITVLAVIGAINAFNMADGIDGLAGSLALTSLSAIAILLTTTQDTYQLALAITLTICILPYLAANLMIKPFKMKIFMGDAGSMLLGFSVAWLLIQTSQSETPAFRPITALWVMAVPLMDMTAVMLRRLSKGRSPFAADRGHLHHKLLDAGFTQRQALLRIVSLSILLSAVGLVGEWVKVPEWLMFGSFIVLFCGYILGVRSITQKGQAKIIETYHENQLNL